MEKTSFRQLQLTQLEILDVFDEFCRNNKLKYSLYAGSLIGAVRHKGFIPWDDDIDICMPRDDYDVFLKKWKKYVSEQEYYLCNYNINRRFGQSFTKIYKNNTTLIYSLEQYSDIPTGINIDVFPVDRWPNGKIKRMLFILRCMYYHLLLRKYPPKDSSFFVIFVCNLLLKIRDPKKDDKRINELLTKITKCNHDNNCEAVFIETMRTLKRVYPKDIFDELIDVEFEGGKYMSVKKWDEALTIDFGDYMKMPPKEERFPPHQVTLVDFENNYEDITNE